MEGIYPVIMMNKAKHRVGNAAIWSLGWLKRSLNTCLSRCISVLIDYIHTGNKQMILQCLLQWTHRSWESLEILALIGEKLLGLALKMRREV